MEYIRDMPANQLKYTALVDSVPDVAHHEQNVLILRFLAKHDK